MKTRVAFVLKLLDDYSGKVIRKEAFLFYIDGELMHPIVKDEGMYVFLEPLSTVLQLKIVSNSYFEQTVMIDRSVLDPQNPVMDVRLFIKCGRSHAYQCEWYTGCIGDKKYSHPVVVCARRAKPTGLVFKSVREENSKKYLIFSGFTQENLVEKTYMLGDKSKADVFIIKEKCGINEYCVEGNFTRKHDAGEKLHRTYRSVTDEKGGYAIPVEGREEDFISEVLVL